MKTALAFDAGSRGLHIRNPLIVWQDDRARGWGRKI